MFDARKTLMLERRKASVAVVVVEAKRVYLVENSNSSRGEVVQIRGHLRLLLLLHSFLLQLLLSISLTTYFHS